MRSGGWLRMQWIARVAFDLGSAPWQPALGARTRRALKALADNGLVERREAAAHRAGDIEGIPVAFDVPRSDWRIVKITPH